MIWRIPFPAAFGILRWCHMIPCARLRRQYAHAPIFTVLGPTVNTAVDGLAEVLSTAAVE